MRFTAATGKRARLMPKIQHFSWRRLGHSTHSAEIHTPPRRL
jgi:hypothetical protein